MGAFFHGLQDINNIGKKLLNHGGQFLQAAIR